MLESIRHLNFCIPQCFFSCAGLLFHECFTLWLILVNPDLDRHWINIYFIFFFCRIGKRNKLCRNSVCSVWFFILTVITIIWKTPPQALTASFNKLLIKCLIKKEEIASPHFKKIYPRCLFQFQHIIAITIWAEDISWGLMACGSASGDHHLPAVINPLDMPYTSVVIIWMHFFWKYSISVFDGSSRNRDDLIKTGGFSQRNINYDKEKKRFLW